ncbi:MAG: 30S ribosomal protein S6e [Nanoarchaeota archaeon]|nr:30S ribosomal protein S6e [Nanoarchaeota archaeon]
MVEFKLVIGDPKTGKCKQVPVANESATFFVGKKIGDHIRGEAFDFAGYEFEITGGADYCGFPMRKDLEGPIRKRIFITTGIGIRKSDKGVKKMKTVCGNTIHEKTTQISLKVLKAGKKPLFEEAAEAAPAEKK